MTGGIVRQDTVHTAVASPKAAGDICHLLPSHPSRLNSFLTSTYAGLGCLLMEITHTFIHERSEPLFPLQAMVVVITHLRTQKHQEVSQWISCNSRFSETLSVSLRKCVPLLRVRISDLTEPKVAGMGITNFPSGPLRVMVRGSTFTLTSFPKPMRSTYWKHSTM